MKSKTSRTIGEKIWKEISTCFMKFLNELNFTLLCDMHVVYAAYIEMQWNTLCSTR